MLFVSTWFVFAIALYILNRTEERLAHPLIRSARRPRAFDLPDAVPSIGANPMDGA